MDYGMLVRNQRDKTLELSGRPNAEGSDQLGPCLASRSSRRNGGEEDRRGCIWEQGGGIGGEMRCMVGRNFLSAKAHQYTSMQHQAQGHEVQLKSFLIFL